VCEFMPMIVCMLNLDLWFEIPSGRRRVSSCARMRQTANSVRSSLLVCGDKNQDKTSNNEQKVICFTHTHSNDSNSLPLSASIRDQLDY